MGKIAFAAAVLVFSAAAADEPVAKADPRAVAECNARGGGFAAVKDCLPDVHVGYAVIDAFHNAFGPDGYPLKDRCLELNGMKADTAAICIREAVRDAVDLKARLAEGSTIDDPLFAVLADPEKLAVIEAAQETARDAFPDKTFWGGVIYKPYRA